MPAPQRSSTARPPSPANVPGKRDRANGSSGTSAPIRRPQPFARRCAERSPGLTNPAAPSRRAHGTSGEDLLAPESEPARRCLTCTRCRHRVSASTRRAPHHTRLWARRLHPLEASSRARTEAPPTRPTCGCADSAYRPVAIATAPGGLSRLRPAFRRPAGRCRSYPAGAGVRGRDRYLDGGQDPRRCRTGHRPRHGSLGPTRSRIPRRRRPDEHVPPHHHTRPHAGRRRGAAGEDPHDTRRQDTGPWSMVVTGQTCAGHTAKIRAIRGRQTVATPVGHRPLRADGRAGPGHLDDRRGPRRPGCQRGNELRPPDGDRDCALERWHALPGWLDDGSWVRDISQLGFVYG